MFGRIFQCLFLVIVTTSAVLAQPQQTVSGQGQPGRTSIVIDRQLVRFLAAGEAQEWKLVVSNQQGEIIFDSGLIHGTALEWPLLNGQGVAVASGLYSYTLTTKTVTDEAARTQRGHLIIDRASNADRVWVTSSPESSLGSGFEARKVTLVGGGEMTVGGAELPGSEMARESAAGKEGTSAVTSAIAGTANRIAKFAADGSTLVDSTVTETASGSIGVGTTNPAAQLTVQGSGDPLLLLNHIGTNGNPALWFQQDGATKAYMWWDRVYGNLNLGTPNKNPIMSLQDNGKVYIGGSVGIGNTQILPFNKLQVRAVGNETGVFAESTGAGYGVYGQSVDGYGVRGTSTGYGAGVYGEVGFGGTGHAGVFNGRVQINGTLTVANNVLPYNDNAFTLGNASQRWKAVYAVNGAIQTSDARLKRDVTDLRYGLSELMRLRPVSFAWKDPEDKQQHLGLIAQETEEVIPEAVAREADPASTLGLNYSTLIPVVIKAIQEQQTTITALKNENEALRRQNTNLLEQNTNLDTRLSVLERRMPHLMSQPQGRTTDGKHQPPQR